MLVEAGNGCAQGAARLIIIKFLACSVVVYRLFSSRIISYRYHGYMISEKCE